MSSVFTIMEEKTPRVKSITFHRSKPILLTAHHSGVIRAYEHQTATLIHEFHDHDGPVRSIIFHPVIDIFVSGGDDCFVRIWNYNERKIVKRLKGHTDYVRSLDFHPTHPWILSTADDQTIKIWNFQSYKLLATLTGHSHYVMSAKFFKENFIISGSLDQSIRVWDCTSLKTPKQKKTIDILKVPDVVVKQILDGHEKGINWIYVHPTQNIFVSGSDDRQIKIWEFNHDIVREKEILHHHQGNVSSVLYVKDILISDGEDGILSIYDTIKKKNKKIVIEERFWCIATNRDFSLFCAGYDSGFKVFSVERLFPLFSVLSISDFQGVYYILNNSLKYNNLKTEKNITNLKKEVNSLHSLEDRVLVQFNNSFEIFRNEKSVFSGNGRGVLVEKGTLVSFQGTVSYVGKEGVIINDSIYFTENEIMPNDENSFIIFKNKTVTFISINNGIKEKMILLNFKPLKSIKRNNYVAILGKKEIAILEYLKEKEEIEVKLCCFVSEFVDVNHGFFYNESFIYSTKRHVKYLLPSSDCGILKSVEKDVYAFLFQENFLFYFTKDGIENVKIDISEFEFKLNVINNNEQEIKRMINSGNLMGLSFLSFLIKKNKGELALPYINDPLQKFEILLSMGKLEECLQFNINNINLIKRVLKEGLKRCDFFVSEKCLKILNDNHGLFMLYLCCNRIDKMMEISYNNLEVLMFLENKSGIENVVLNCFNGIYDSGNKCDGKSDEKEEKSDISDDNISLKNKNKNDINDNKCDINKNKNKYDNKYGKSEDKIKFEDSGNENEVKDNKSKNNNNDDDELCNVNENLNLENELLNKSKNNNKDDIKNVENINKDVNKNDNTMNDTNMNDKTKFIVIENINKNILGEINKKEKWDSAMKNTTEGKFNAALNDLYVISHNLANDIYKSGKDDEELRKMVGFYISGLNVEKNKKKTEDPQKCIEMSLYFSNLPLLDDHKTLALSNSMMVCFKNENFSTAKKIAEELKKRKMKVNIEKSVKRVTMTEKTGDKYFINDGIFCYDTLSFMDCGYKCSYCCVYSFKKGICKCCCLGYVDDQ